MKPFLNLKKIVDFKERREGRYEEKYAVVGEIIGAKKLQYSLTIVPPGKTVCPFHNHRVSEEMFLILEGQGTLRFGSDSFQIGPFDIIACPPGDKRVAHQILNTGKSHLKYLCLGTKEDVEICEYPDSNKILSKCFGDREPNFLHISKLSEVVHYFDGEN